MEDEKLSKGADAQKMKGKRRQGRYSVIYDARFALRETWKEWEKYGEQWQTIEASRKWIETVERERMVRQKLGKRTGSKNTTRMPRGELTTKIFNMTLVL